MVSNSLCTNEFAVLPPLLRMIILGDEKKKRNALSSFDEKLGHVCLAADEAKPFTHLEPPIHVCKPEHYVSLHHN